MPSIKNIFTAKGYEVGSDYNREVGYGDERSAIQYRVVADGVPTYLVIGDEYFKEIHTEALGSVVHRIEDDMYTELEVLSQDQVEALQDRISGLVNHDTYELGLAGENPENIDDRLIIYLTSWRDLHYPDVAQDGETVEEKLARGDSINQAVSDEFEEIRDLEIRDIIRLTANLASEIILDADETRPLTTEQRDNVFNWMVEKNSKHQITTMDKVINRYDQIKYLLGDYQLSAADIGLSFEQAEIISIAQYNYVTSIYNHFYQSEGVEILPERLQAKFEEVRDLTEKHQLVSFHLGLTAEQAQDVSPPQSTYLILVFQSAAVDGVAEKKDIVRAEYAQMYSLREIHQINAFRIGLPLDQAQAIHPYDSNYLFNLAQTAHAHHAIFSPEEAHQTFQQIDALQPHQKTAFRYNVPLLAAANLSEENFKNIIEISNRVVDLPNREEITETRNQRKFIESYHTFVQEQEAAQAQAKLDAAIAQANLQAPPLAPTTTNSVANPPPLPSTTTNPQRVNKRDRETDGDETGSNKKPDRSH